METMASLSASVRRPDGSVSAPFAEAVMEFHLPIRQEYRYIMRSDAARVIHGMLVKVARCRGALDLAIDDGLAALAKGDALELEPGNSRGALTVSVAPLRPIPMRSSTRGPVLEKIPSGFNSWITIHYRFRTFGGPRGH